MKIAMTVLLVLTGTTVAAESNLLGYDQTSSATQRALEARPDAQDDELVEVTPDAIRIRKRRLKEHERKREAREADKATES